MPSAKPVSAKLVAVFALPMATEFQLLSPALVMLAKSVTVTLFLTR